MIRLAVCGATGRMGQRVCALAADEDRFTVTWRMDSSTAEQDGGDGGVDAVIDFSTDEGARRAAETALRHEAALLVATTALSPGTLDVLGESARRVPVMIAPNTSRGMAVLEHLACRAARLLGGGFDVDLIDQHHRHKRDAPSGSARRLLASMERETGRSVPADRVHCLRAGEIVGEHEVLFSGPSERIRLMHDVSSRDVFAAGALDAVAWLHAQGPGLYSVQQWLGLGEESDEATKRRSDEGP